MNWQKRLELAWENGCASARRYRGSHSDLLVPVHYKDKDGFALGEWIVYNRQRYLSGNLPSDRVERLEALGMVWDTGSILWEKSYAAAVQYYLEITRWKFPSSMSRRTAWRWASGWAVSVPLIKKVC